MIGPFFGAACLIGLGVLFARRRRHWHGYGPRFGGHHGYRRGWRRHGLRHVLQRLDTTPGQEKAILGAIDDLRARAEAARDGIDETQSNVAAALREETLDEHAFAGLFDGHLAQIDSLRDDVARAVSTIHEALTPKQRARLADLVESRRHFRPMHGL
jgi:Spy/CpxP family protein refolding chaperone